MIGVAFLYDLKNLHGLVEKSLVKIDATKSCEQVPVVWLFVTAIDQTQYLV